jgi:hypothetical protein
MLKTVLLALGMCMSIGIYVPLFRRILKRKATRDFSKVAQCFICAVQVNGFILATAEHASYLMGWYVLQTILTASQLALIYYFWDTPHPLLRGEK